MHHQIFKSVGLCSVFTFIHYSYKTSGLQELNQMTKRLAMKLQSCYIQAELSTSIAIFHLVTGLCRGFLIPLHIFSTFILSSLDEFALEFPHMGLFTWPQGHWFRFQRKNQQNKKKCPIFLPWSLVLGPTQSVGGFEGALFSSINNHLSSTRNKISPAAGPIALKKCFFFPQNFIASGPGSFCSEVKSQGISSPFQSYMHSDVGAALTAC